MTQKLTCAVLGATGVVGQNYVLLLKDHPWFEITYVAASPASAGKPYAEAVDKKWFMDRDVPKNIGNLVVGDANKPEDAIGKCDFVFSSIDGSKEQIQALENQYAKLGFPLVTNNSAHRWTPNIPMIIPEINPHHLDIIPAQQRANNWEGFIVTKSNCSILSDMTPVHAPKERGYPPARMTVSTLQALSGAGYPGVPSLDIIDNVIPYIPGEEDKTEREPLKIFGTIDNGRIINYEGLAIYATCTRVPVINGHMAIVNLEFADKAPGLEELIKIWEEFRGVPQLLYLPSAPAQPIIYRREENRPQPRKDRDAGNGMAVTVGRLKQCSDKEVRFIGLSHNTNRGAAGGAILTAELLKYKGLIKEK